MSSAPSTTWLLVRMKPDLVDDEAGSGAFLRRHLAVGRRPAPSLALALPLPLALAEEALQQVVLAAEELGQLPAARRAPSSGC